MPRVVNIDNCSGCLRCSLACSFHNSPEQAFSLSRSLIKVEPLANDGRTGIRILEGCLECGVCVDHCHYGVLAGD